MTRETYPAVSGLLPHGPPMVLLDEVVGFDGRTVSCRLRIRQGAPLVDGGRARAAVALEYMAQAVGVCTALVARAKGEPSQTGYLVAARTLELDTAFFLVGDELLVEAAEEFAGEELGTFDCTVSRDGEIVARATISVYRGPRAREEGP